MDRKIKVGIADDHQLLIEGVKMTINEWDEFEVSWFAKNGQDVLQNLKNNVVDILLIDIKMPIMNGIETTKVIKKEYPNVKVVALSTFDDIEIISGAIDAGCNGFLLKVIEPDQLRLSLHTIMSGGNVFDNSVIEAYRKKEQALKTCNFTPRELKVLEYICNGDSNKEIASKLSL